MNMFFYRRLDSNGEVAMQRFRPLLQSELGIIVIADTNDIPGDRRIVIDSLEIAGTLATIAAFNSTQSALTEDNEGEIWFRSDTGDFYEVTFLAGERQFTLLAVPVAPELPSDGGGNPGTPGDNGIVVKLTPSLITASSTDVGNIANISDGNTATVWTTAGQGGSVDIDLGTAKHVHSARWFPRADSAGDINRLSRLVGMKFYGANQADFSDAVQLSYTLETTPPWDWVITPFNNLLPIVEYRYIRMTNAINYWGLAELEINGHD